MKSLLVFFLIFFCFKTIYSPGNNFCIPAPFYVQEFSKSTFELITLTVSIKNNDHSLSNTKNIKSTLSISKSNSSTSLFKILTVHRNSLEIPSQKEKEELWFLLSTQPLIKTW